MRAVTFSIPYDSKFSDNQKFIGGDVRRVNAAYTAMKQRIFYEMEKAKISFKKEKVFVRIFQHRKDMRNDTHNFVKLICDGIKLWTARKSLPPKLRVDDNWFCVMTDWKIDKENPGIEITVYQE